MKFNRNSDITKNMKLIEWMKNEILMSVSELFNILNTRLLSGKKTIISTNLSPMQLGDIYAQRIFSRIFDRFRMVKFIGNDLRWEQKMTK